MAAAQNVSFVCGEDEFKTLMRSVYPSGLDGMSLIPGRRLQLRRIQLLGSRPRCGSMPRIRPRRTSNPPSKVPRRRSGREAAPRIPARRRDEARRVTGREASTSRTSVGFCITLPFPMEDTSKRGRRHRRTPYLTSASRPSDSISGFVMARESTSAPMSGIHGLHWFPTGPNVVIESPRAPRFGEFRILYNKKRPTSATTYSSRRRPTSR